MRGNLSYEHRCSGNADTASLRELIFPYGANSLNIMFSKYIFAISCRGYFLALDARLRKVVVTLLLGL